MRLLLDTNILYWTFYEADRLPKRARQLMIDADEIVVSSATIWEVAIKSRLNKINADTVLLVNKVRESGFTELTVSYEHAMMIATLPLHHTDPFDRMLIAQAMSEPLHLLTADSRLAQYTGLVIQV